MIAAGLDALLGFPLLVLLQAHRELLHVEIGHVFDVDVVPVVRLGGAEVEGYVV